MKNSKIITTFATLTLVLFMSVTSIANPFAGKTGEITKTAVKKQITPETSHNNASALSSENEFSHLRFDVNKFINESETAEFVADAVNYLRFDVSNFSGISESEISELPVANELEYLHFNVNDYTLNNSADLVEMPANELDYLRFDVNNFSAYNSFENVEL